MKKRILFVIPSLYSGGAEKSLVSLLSLFDYEKYEVDLLLFRREGLFLEKVPKEINLIYDTTDYEIFDGDVKQSLKYFLGKGDFSIISDLIKYRKSFREEDMCWQEYKSWQILKKRLPKITKEYDCAIAYLEGNSCDFVSDITTAKKKIFYVHTNINNLPHINSLYKELFSKADKIVTVSKVCFESFTEEFPEYTDKCSVIENIISRSFISEEASEEMVFDRTDDTSVILTVGRCSEPKNIELAVRTCSELKDRGRKIKWYHIGKGPLVEKIGNMVKEFNLENEFIMLGEKSNPYAYMAQCDIYVQPSLYEGKSIAIDEVKCLCKPIVVTDFPTVFDQITDGENGLICKMNEEDMADKIEKLIDDEKLREKFAENLRTEKVGNEEEIEKLYDLIES